MKTSKKRRFWTVLCIILGVILALLLAMTIAVNAILNKIPRYDPSENTLSQEEIQQIIEETDPPEVLEGLEEIPVENVTLPEKPAEIIENSDHIYNILLIGQDRRPGQGRQRSDAMILCTIDTEKKTLVMTSFLRDTYIDIPDYRGESFDDNRLNACYVFGGMELLNDAMLMNFGITVDHNIEVDFAGFQNIVNIFGGVGIELTAAEAAIVQGGAQAGWNHLNGEQALNYARIRSLDGDTNRTYRQRKLLMSMFESIRNLSLDQMRDLVNAVFPMVTTDMTNADMLHYLFAFFPLITDIEISTQYIPAAGTAENVMIRGMAVKVPDLEENRRILKETLGE